MIETSEKIDLISPAIIAFQMAVRAVKRDGNNPHFKSKYATLENVMDAAKPVLNENDISVIQGAGAIIDGAVTVTTRLQHESGQFMQSTLHVPLGKRDPQGVGSALTYGFRYSLMGMLGLPPTDDDDGENAMDRKDEYAKPRQSSAALKRDDAWKEFTDDLMDCKSLKQLEEIKKDWHVKVAKDGWPKAWIASMPDEFAAKEKQIMDEIEKQEQAA